MSDWRKVIDQVLGTGPCWCHDRAVRSTAPAVETLFSLCLHKKEIEPNFVPVDIALARAAGS